MNELVATTQPLGAVELAVLDRTHGGPQPGPLGRQSGVRCSPVRLEELPHVLPLLVTTGRPSHPV